MRLLMPLIIGAIVLAGCKSTEVTGPGGGGIGGGGGGGGGGSANTVTVSGRITDHAGIQNYNLEIVFSHDQTLDDQDYETNQVQVGLNFSNITFNIPEGYSTNDYMIIFALSDCVDADGDGYEDDIIFGCYPDMQNNRFVFMRVQTTVTNINLDAQYYFQDGCGGGGILNANHVETKEVKK